MKVPCRIYITTLLPEKQAYDAHGFTEYVDDRRRLCYDGDGFSMEITFCAREAVFLRHGEDGYTLVLRPDGESELRLREGCIPAVAHTLKWRETDTGAKFLARYTIGGEAITVRIDAIYDAPALS